MKAVQVRAFGGPEVLESADIETPEPGDNEILIRVKAAGVNFGDAVVRTGGAPIDIPRPFTPGSEAAGVVTRIGKNVHSLDIGDRVLAPLFLEGRLGGGYAEFAEIDASLAFALPDDIDFDEAIALSMQGLTAWLMLGQVPVAEKTVLITAAAGGVGSLLVQLARLQGAKKVIAAFGDPTKRALVETLGADAAISYQDADWTYQVLNESGGNGPDIIFDGVGGGVRRTGLATLAPMGVFLAFGGSAVGGYGDALSAEEVARFLVRNQSFQGFSMWPLLGDRAGVRTLVQTAFTALYQLLRTDKLRITIGEVYAMEDAARAHLAIEERRSVGKIILRP